jgi:hypothetical protein
VKRGRVRGGVREARERQRVDESIRGGRERKRVNTLVGKKSSS